MHSFILWVYINNPELLAQHTRHKEENATLKKKMTNLQDQLINAKKGAASAQKILAKKATDAANAAVSMLTMMSSIGEYEGPESSSE